MSDAYVECLVEGKPNTLFKVLKVLLIILAVAAFVLCLYSGRLWIFIIAVVLGGGSYYIGMYTDVEYEYLYLDKEITIDKVFNKSSRKRVAVYSLEKMEIIAPIKSYHLDSFRGRTCTEKDYSIGFEDQPDLRYVMYYEGNQKIIFSPNEEMIKTMKNVSPRKVFTD